MSNKKEINANFKTNVRKLTSLTGTTPTELSEMTGVSKSTLRRINLARLTKTEYRPSFVTVARLAKFAGVSAEDFATGKLTA